MKPMTPELASVWAEAFGSNKYKDMCLFLESFSGQPATMKNKQRLENKRQEYLDWIKYEGLDYLLSKQVKTPYEWYTSLRLIDILQRIDYLIYQIERISNNLESAYLQDRDNRIKEIMEEKFGDIN